MSRCRCSPCALVVSLALLVTAPGGAAPALARDGATIAQVGLPAAAPPPSPPPPVAPGAQLTPPPRATPTAPDPTTDEPSGEPFPLRPTDDGGYDYRGSRIAAHIGPDGSVRFSRPSPVVVGPEASRMPPRPPTTTATPYDDPHAGSPYYDPPRVPVVQPIIAAAGVRFDITDEYRRLLGEHPERDAQARFLAATFDLRTRMAAEYHGRQRAARLAELPHDLEAIWSDPRRSRSEKLRIIELYRAELGAGTDSAPAAAFEDFARRHLSPEEKARFDQRR